MRFTMLALSLILSALPSVCSAARTSLPFQFDDNRIVVMGDVVGATYTAKRVQVWVDNGNPDIWITSELAEKLKLKRLSPDTDTPMGKAFRATAPRALVIGGIRLDIPETTNTDVFENPTIGPGLRAVINVPASAWRRSDINIDYADNTIKVDTSGHASHQGTKIHFQIEPPTSRIRLPIVIDGVKYLAGLDIGATYSFIDQRLIDSLLSAHPNWPHVTGSLGPANIWGWPGEEQATILRIPQLTWGGVVIRNLGVAPLPPDSNQPLHPDDVVGVIGADLLRHGQLDIDFRHGVVYFGVPNYIDDDDLVMAGITLQPRPDGQYSILGIVKGDRSCSTVGVQAGDWLMSIDGTAVANQTMGSVIHALAGKPGEIKHLILDRGGKSLDATACVFAFLNAASPN